MKHEVSPKDVLPFMNRITQVAGRIIMSYYRGEFTIDSKGESRSGGIDIVTDADRASEDAIVDAIQKEFPGHDIITEERPTERTGARYLWVLDPLDGTVNFAHGYPIFSVSIALMCDEEPIAGMIFDPVHEETFSCVRDHGSFFNGNLTRVTRADALEKSIIATGFPYDRFYSPENNVLEFSKVVTKVQGIRRGGSAALDLAYVACGRLDGFWELKLKPWDMAAGMLMVVEAGGRVTDRLGNSTNMYTDCLVATNARIHDRLLALLGEAEAEKQARNLAPEASGA
jgi:myo-inositol-1(or 4)-monophosphatase